MSYSQSKKLTPEEKKLQSLKLQLYGKERSYSSAPSPKTQNQATYNNNVSDQKIQIPTVESVYLRPDLLKILGLAAVLVGSEVLLYILSVHKVLKF